MVRLRVHILDADLHVVLVHVDGARPAIPAAGADDAVLLNLDYLHGRFHICFLHCVILHLFYDYLFSVHDVHALRRRHV